MIKMYQDGATSRSALSLYERLEWWEARWLACKIPLTADSWTEKECGNEDSHMGTLTQ